MNQTIQDKLQTLPTSPGVYVFRDARGAPLYVGKARNLRSRVRSYFQPGSSDVRAFVARLESELEDIETFVAGTEKEAALLENQLIKENQPRYNVKLRDDKDYLSLRLAPNAAWPRLEVVRRPKPDGAMYFGPYDSATAARKTLRLVNRHFQLRTCTDSELKSRRRPCLQYQIRRCPAPCVFEVSRAEYGTQVTNVAMFLEGRHDELLSDLKKRMKAASEALQYELAAVNRDQLRAVARVHEEQRVATVTNLDQDVVGVFRQADQAEVALLLLRSGKLTGVRTFALHDVSLPDDELIASFLSEYYTDGTFRPHEVLVPLELEAMDGVSEALSAKQKRKTRVLRPKRGPKRKLVEMAHDNARHAYEEKARQSEDIERRLGEVKRRLHLSELPRRIECVDISHTGGENTVGVFVSLYNGAPDRKRYRSFRVRRVSGGDDYGAMHEVLSRRIRRGRNDEAGWELPDLLLVDGGRGQLNVLAQVLKELGVESLAIAALAKEKETLKGEKVIDRVYRPGQKNPIVLRDSHPALRMLSLARDEAHRASNALRVKVGKKRQFENELEAVPGIGRKTRTMLLTALGSTQAVIEASRDELMAAGATKRQAEAIWSAYNTDLGPDDAQAEEAAIANAFDVQD